MIVQRPYKSELKLALYKQNKKGNYLIFKAAEHSYCSKKLTSTRDEHACFEIKPTNHQNSDDQSGVTQKGLSGFATAPWDSIMLFGGQIFFFCRPPPDQYANLSMILVFQPILV